MTPMFAHVGTRPQASGLRVCQVAWHLSVTVREYRELEAGTRFPTFEIWDRMCKLYGWSQSFVASKRR